MNEAKTVDAIFIALRQIIRAIDLRSRFLVNNFGITGPQKIVMLELAERGGISVCDLKKAVHLSQATVTGIVDRLEQKGFVRRQKCKIDKRRIELWITEKGIEVLKDSPAMLQNEFTDKFEKLENWEKAQLLSSLQRVASMMEAKDIDATPMLTTGPILATTEQTKDFLKSSETDTVL